jgi:dTDP-N-acetylfucosamine:lipid II N-acetylfucosaminyltransferase
VNILHLVYDEKFVNFTAELFESCAGVTSRYLVLHDDSAAPPRYVSSLSDMRAIGSGYFGSRAMKRDLDWCDALIIHYLGLPGAKMIVGASDRVQVAWSGWGGDYYDLLPNADDELLGASTKCLLASIKRDAVGKLSLRGQIRSVLARFRSRCITKPFLRRAIQRVDYFSAPVPEDFGVLKRAMRGVVHAKYAQLNYASVEHTFNRGLASVAGDAILVGNSASATNNHADVFDLLAGLRLGDRTIVVPLSYGDPTYRDAVITYGQRLFAGRFAPLVRYLSLEQYNAAIGTCSIAVMGHRRQQGLGNIATMMLRGARVYMDRVSPVFQHMKTRGAIISDLDELKQQGSAALTPLSPDEQRVNQCVVEAEWGHDIVLQNVRRFIDRLKLRVATDFA